MDRGAGQAIVCGLTGQRSRAGDSLWAHKESDTAEHGLAAATSENELGAFSNKSLSFPPLTFWQPSQKTKPARDQRGW